MGTTECTLYISKRHVILMFVVFTNLRLIRTFAPKIIPKLAVCFLTLVGMVFVVESDKIRLENDATLVSF